MSDSPGYVITPICTKRDIDECTLTDPPVCHENAVCQNFDATTPPHGMYSCVCPPGMMGDGVTKCSVNTYNTLMAVAINDIPPTAFDVEAFIDNLYLWGVVPPYISRDRINVTVSQIGPVDDEFA